MKSDRTKMKRVAEELCVVGPQILEQLGHDIKIGCENKDYQRLVEKGTAAAKKKEYERFDADKEAYKYAMLEKIIEQAKILTAYGGGHIPITKLEGTRVGGWR